MTAKHGAERSHRRSTVRADRLGRRHRQRAGRRRRRTCAGVLEALDHGGLPAAVCSDDQSQRREELDCLSQSKGRKKGLEGTRERSCVTRRGSRRWRNDGGSDTCSAWGGKARMPDMASLQMDAKVSSPPRRGGAARRARAPREAAAASLSAAGTAASSSSSSSEANAGSSGAGRFRRDDAIGLSALYFDRRQPEGSLPSSACAARSPADADRTRGPLRLVLPVSPSPSGAHACEVSAGGGVTQQWRSERAAQPQATRPPGAERGRPPPAAAASCNGAKETSHGAYLKVVLGRRT